MGKLTLEESAWAGFGNGQMFMCGVLAIILNIGSIYLFGVTKYNALLILVGIFEALNNSSFFFDHQRRYPLFHLVLDGISISFVGSLISTYATLRFYNLLDRWKRRFVLWFQPIGLLGIMMGVFLGDGFISVGGIDPSFQLGSIVYGAVYLPMYFMNLFGFYVIVKHIESNPIHTLNLRQLLLLNLSNVFLLIYAVVPAAMLVVGITETFWLGGIILGLTLLLLTFSDILFMFNKHMVEPNVVWVGSRNIKFTNTLDDKTSQVA